MALRDFWTDVQSLNQSIRGGVGGEEVIGEIL